SSSLDRTVKVWNTRNATCERTLTDHEDSVVSCDVSHDGHYVASGSLDGTCRLWDLHRGVCLTTIRKHTKWVLCVRFSPDGRYLASSGLDCKVFIWEVKALILGKGMARPRSIEGHTAHISHMQFGTGLGARLYTISKDCTLRCWDYITGQELYHVSTHPLGITCFQLSPNGAFIAAGTVANTILLFHSQTLVQFRAIRVLNLGIMTVKVFLDNAQLLVGTQEGVVQTIPL
ncbi:WD40 repeat-like protein, partial [Caulochytrium protostelioides]